MHIAHKSEKGIQTVKEHSENTANLCKEYAIDELKDLCYMIGLLHDVGKYQAEFQKKINDNLNIQVEHSICGAKEICPDYESKNIQRYIAALCIAGHHTGIPNSGKKFDSKEETTLWGRLKRKTESYDEYKEELHFSETDLHEFVEFVTKDCKSNKDLIEKLAFVTRYCFSCLTDADSIDTANAMNGPQNRSLTSNFKKCLEKINKKFDGFVCETDLQKARSIIQKQVYEKVNIDSNIYLMNMPTGSGKTLCSMKFALKRAIAKDKKRIIYVIPYNSIIDQTAKEFETLFREDSQLLRHQSTFSFNENEEGYTAKLSSENWDAQMIITTSVQFFESIYGNKRGKLRKLHNMADSIIIFDEAHLMPIDCLEPCLRGIVNITRMLNSEAVFLTATMPNYENILKEYGIANQIVNLVTDKSEFAKFKKCTFEYIGVQDDENIIQKAKEYPTTLIVTNSKRGTRDLYKLCTGKIYHLSTYMTAVDRIKTIEEIKKELNSLSKKYKGLQNVPADERITVVSTSLIEAGVDLDFSAVFREITGLDSILQSGGRCNREGHLKDSKVFVFERESRKDKPKRPETIFTENIIKKYKDISSAEAIEDYYKAVFSYNVANGTEMISDMCENDIYKIPFADYNLKIINDNKVSLVIEQDEKSKGLIEKLKTTGFTNMRELQKYCCSISNGELDILIKQGVIANYESGVLCLTNPDYYNVTGIQFEGKDLWV